MKVAQYQIEVHVFPDIGGMLVRATCSLNCGSMEAMQFLLNRAMQISCLRVNGRDIEHSEDTEDTPHEAKRVTVDHDPELQADALIEVECHAWCLAEEITPESPDWAGIIAIGPDEFRVSPQSVWYPVFKASGRKSDYCRAPAEIMVKVPDAFAVMATGKLLEVRRQEIRKTYVWKTSVRCQYSMIGRIGSLVECTVNDGDNCCRMLLADGNVTVKDQLAKVMYSVRSHLQEQLGQPAHGEVGLAEMTLRGRRSYAYCTNSYIVLSNRLLDRLRHGLSFGAVSVIAHEVAHWWIPGTAAVCGESGSFLSESIAEYLAREYLGCRYGRAIERLLYLRDAMELARGEPSASQSGRHLGYSKGPWLWRMLRRSCDLDIKRMIALICLKYRETSFAEKEFWESAQQCSAMDLNEFKMYWWEGVKIPSITYDYRYYPIAGGRYRVDLQVRCDADMAPCRAVAEVATANETKRVALELPSAGSFSVEVPGPVRNVAVDPETEILARRLPRVGEVIAALRSLLPPLSQLPDEPSWRGMIVGEVCRCLDGILWCCRLKGDLLSGTTEIPKALSYLAGDWRKSMRADSGDELKSCVEELRTNLEQSLRRVNANRLEDKCWGDLARQIEGVIGCIEDGRRPAVEWGGAAGL